MRLFGERLGLCKCAEACPENSMKAASDFLLLSNRKKEGKWEKITRRQQVDGRSASGDEIREVSSTLMMAPLGFLCEYVGPQVLGKTNPENLKKVTKVNAILDARSRFPNISNQRP